MGGYVDEERLGPIDDYRRPRYPVWVECLKVFLMFSIGGLVILYAAYDLAAETNRYLLFAAGFFLMPVISTVVRRYSRNLLLFLFPHALFIVYDLMLSPDLILTALGMLYVIALILYGMVRQMSRQPEKEMSMIVLFAAVFIMLLIYALAA